MLSRMDATKTDAAEGFAKAFPALQPLICAEWAQVDAKALAATDGDYDEVVARGVSATEHSKTRVNRHLDERLEIAGEDQAKAPAGDRGAAAGDNVLGAAQRSLQEALRVLQAKANEVAEYIRKQALGDAKTKIEQHPLLVTVLMAIGLGMILGFLLRGPGRDRYPRNRA